MKLGKMRHIISIEQKAKATDIYGGEIDSWTTFAAVWASIEPLMGREVIAAQAAQSEISVRFRTRYLAGVNSTMRIVYKGQNYEIKAPPINVNNEDRELIILTSAGTGGA